jgi:hypothetical protein
MKKISKKAKWTSLIGLSLLGTTVISTGYAEAIGFGGGGAKVYHTTVDGTVTKLRFNPNFNGSQNNFYPANQEFYREVYLPENGLTGGFVWFSIVPPKQQMTSLSQTDMSKMLENRQTTLGNNRDHLVQEASNKSYKNNLKYGSADPYVGKYRGMNTGTKKIQYGDFKGKNYEWRFLGYNLSGNAIGNPYFPDDDQSRAQEAISSQHEAGVYWSNRNWNVEGWNAWYSVEQFGAEDALNEKQRKIRWINDILFKQYPEFKNRGNASWWADRLRPLTNPEEETGIWLGWHLSGGNNWYTTFVTPPPEQSNLRLTSYKIYDSQNRLVATETRSGSGYENVESNVDIKRQYIHKGETYRMEVDVKNMTDKKQDIKNYPIELEHMYSFDDDIGDVSGYSTSIMKDTADSPHQRELKSGETAHFSYTYTVPTTGKPKEFIQFNAQIPEGFFNEGYNTIDDDDTASIAFEIAPENLGVEFEGYYDLDKNPVDYVTPNYQMWVKYKVTKTDGTQPVNGADLKIKVSDTKTVTTNQTYNFDGAYDKNGRRISDGVLKKDGDYAIFWASITPRNPKLCTEASIPGKWANKGLNGFSEDDVAKPECLVNPDNIVVSNVDAKPETVFLSSSQGRKSVQYTVSYNLTNYNYDGKDKVIPVVYTIDGRVVKTEQVPVDSLRTMKISRILPAVNVGEGEHIVQVEANPKPRKYIEVKTNSNGKEVDPYTDNIGWDKVNVERNVDEFCKVRHTANYWNTRFQLEYLSGWRYWHSTEDGGHYHSGTDFSYQYQTVGFYEKQEIKNIFFRSKFTSDKQGGWVDLLNTKGTIKAGYGFELKVVTNYQTNTYNDTPKSWNEGWHIGRYAKNVSPTYSVVDSSAKLRVTMPFTDDSGKPIAIALSGKQTGSWYNTTTTYELESRNVINKPEKKIYVNENTKDGNYNVRVETQPFYGSYDKPSTSARLCDIKNVTVEVKGSYLDDVKTHVVQ